MVAGDIDAMIAPMADEPIRLDYADPTIDRMIVIAAYHDEFEVRLAAGRLEAEGINALVTVPSRAYGRSGQATTLAVLISESADAIEILRLTPAKRFVIEPKAS